MKMEIYKYEVSRHYVGDGEALYQISMPETAAEYLKKLGLHKKPEEHFYVLLLNVKNQVVGYHEVSKGLLDRSHVHPREVFRVAILNNASKIILAHNHPSGDTTPSKQDMESTSNMVKAGELLGIKVIDHIIVAENLGNFNHTSMRSAGHFE